MAKSVSPPISPMWSRSMAVIATPEQLSKSVGELANPRFAVREKASKTLWEAGRASETLLREAAKSSDEETANRAKAILEKFDWGIYPDTVPEPFRAMWLKNGMPDDKGMIKYWWRGQVAAFITRFHPRALAKLREMRLQAGRCTEATSQRPTAVNTTDAAAPASTSQHHQQRKQLRLARCWLSF